VTLRLFVGCDNCGADMSEGGYLIEDIPATEPPKRRLLCGPCIDGLTGDWKFLMVWGDEEGEG